MQRADLQARRPDGTTVGQDRAVTPGIRFKVDHSFRAIERQFGYLKTHYQEPEKNAAQMVTLFAQSNLCMARQISWTRRLEIV